MSSSTARDDKIASGIPTARKSKSPEATLQKHIDETRRLLHQVDLSQTFLSLGTLGFGTLLVAMLADHWIFKNGLNVPLRIVFFAGLFALLVYFVYRRIVPLFLYPINPVYAADVLEKSTPSLKNSLVNWLLLRRERTERGRISNSQLAERMVDGLSFTAARDIVSVSSDKAVDMRGLACWGTVFVLMLAFLIGYIFLSPKNPLTSMARVILPFSSIETPQAVRFLNVQPGDALAFQGERLEVFVELAGRIARNEPVYLLFSTDDGQAVGQAIPMLPTERSDKNQYSVLFPPGKQGFVSGTDYWFQQGESRSAVYRVDVKELASLEIASVNYVYPAYTGLPDESVELVGDLKAVEGTEAQIVIRSTLPLEQAWIVFNNDSKNSISMRVFGDDRTQARTSIVMKRPTDTGTSSSRRSFSFRAIDQEGNESRRSGMFRMEVLPDQPPVVRWSDSSELLRDAPQIDLPVNASVELPVEAEDIDFSLRFLRFFVESEGKNVRPQDLLDSSNDGPTEHLGVVKRNISFSPSKFRLSAGNVAEIWVEAVDSKLPEANTATTRRITVRVQEAERKDRSQESKKSEQQTLSKDEENKQDNQDEEKNSTQNSQQQSSEEEHSKDQENHQQTKGADELNQNKDENRETERNDQRRNQGDKQSEESKDKENQQDGKNDRNQGNGTDTEDKAEDRQDGEGSSNDKESGSKNSEQQSACQNGQNTGQSGDQRDGQKNPNEQSSGNKDGEGQKQDDRQQKSPGDKQDGKQGSQQGHKQNQKIDPETDPGGAIEQILDRMKREGKLPPDEELRGEKPNDSERLGDNQQDQQQQSGQQDQQQENQQQTQSQKQEQQDKGPDGRRKPPEDGLQGPGDQQQNAQQDENNRGNQGQRGEGQSQDKQNSEAQKSDSNQGDKDSDQADDQSQRTGKDGDQSPKGGESGETSGSGQQGDSDSASEQRSGNKEKSTRQDVPVNPNDTAPRQRGDLDPNLDQRRNQGNNANNPKESDKPDKDRNTNSLTDGGEGKGQETMQQGQSDKAQSAQDGKEGNQGSQGQQTAKQEGSSEGEGNTKQGGGNDSQHQEQQSESGEGNQQGNQQGSQGKQGSQEQSGPEQNQGKGSVSNDENLGQNSPSGKSDSDSDEAGPITGEPDNRQTATTRLRSGTGGGADGSSPTEREEANLEYARKVTNLVLDYLEDQLEKGPDQDLLDDFGWTEDQLREYHAKWKEMSENSLRDPDSTNDMGNGGDAWTEFLKSVGLKPGSFSQDRQQTRTQVQDNVKATESQRYAPPDRFKGRFKTYTERIAR